MSLCKDVPFQIRKTNSNEEIIEVDINELNTSSLDIGLVGDRRKNYGETFNENLLFILENFAAPEDSGNVGNPDTTATTNSVLSNPTTGQFWYNSTSHHIYFFDGTNWKPLQQIGDVAGNSGTIADGEQIPQPVSDITGYVFPYEECSWVVAPSNYGVEIDYMRCYTDSSANVTFEYRESGSLTYTSGIVNYQIIGIRDNNNLGNRITPMPPTPTPTPTSSVTPTPTPTPTSTPTPTPTPTSTPTPTPTPTSTPTPTPTSSVTPTPSITPTSSVTPTPSNTPDPSNSPTPSVSESATPTPTPTPSNSEVVIPTPTPTNTATATAVPAPSPSNTPAPSPSNTPAPSPSNTPAPSPSNTPAPSPSNTPAPSPSNTPTPSPTYPPLSASNATITDSDSCFGQAGNSVNFSFSWSVSSSTVNASGGSGNYSISPSSFSWNTTQICSNTGIQTYSTETVTVSDTVTGETVNVSVTLQYEIFA